eukprot:3671256-Rhodomonas_salina.1
MEGRMESPRVCSYALPPYAPTHALRNLSPKFLPNLLHILLQNLLPMLLHTPDGISGTDLGYAPTRSRSASLWDRCAPFYNDTSSIFGGTASFLGGTAFFLGGYVLFGVDGLHLWRPCIRFRRHVYWKRCERACFWRG